MFGNVDWPHERRTKHILGVLVVLLGSLTDILVPGKFQVLLVGKHLL